MDGGAGHDLGRLSACGKAKTFTGSQLGSILLEQADTPAGLDFRMDSSGPQTIDEIAKDDADKAKLAGNGFVSAYSTFFANDSGLAVISRRTTVADPNAEVLATLGAVFKTAEGAAKSLAIEHARDLATGTNMKTVAVPKIGDETVAEHGIQANLPFPGYLIYWREGNAFFAVLVAGGPTAGITLAEATAFAKTMDARAKKA